MNGVSRQYQGAGVTVRVRGLESGSARLHIEHESGAALIVPFCAPTALAGGWQLDTRGFDGTRFLVEVRDEDIALEASAPTAILGGEQRLRLPRSAAEPAPTTGRVRITGDEPTMPIGVKK